MGTLEYLKNFLKDPDVASVTPSSRYTIRRVCKPISFDEDLIIIEYGAASGVFARYLLPKMTESSRLVLFETNKNFFEQLQDIDDPRVELYMESAEKVEQLTGGAYRGKTDYIISGIPFSFLKGPVKRSILNQSYRMLKEGGSFLAYQTSEHLKKTLQNVFGNVSVSREWRNIPPMTLYRADKIKKMQPTE
ncbi:MAG: class I SAM-dependent methyltransferase [Balneolaceae bacterium]